MAKVKFTGKRTGLKEARVGPGPAGLVKKGDVIEVPDAEADLMVVAFETGDGLKADWELEEEEAAAPKAKGKAAATNEEASEGEPQTGEPVKEDVGA